MSCQLKLNLILKKENYVKKKKKEILSWCSICRPRIPIWILCMESCNVEQKKLKILKYSYFKILKLRNSLFAFFSNTGTYSTFDRIKVDRYFIFII